MRAAGSATTEHTTTMPSERERAHTGAPSIDEMSAGNAV